MVCATTGEAAGTTAASVAYGGVRGSDGLENCISLTRRARPAQTDAGDRLGICRCKRTHSDG
jgi:hypothetical protein